MFWLKVSVDSGVGTSDYADASLDRSVTNLWSSDDVDSVASDCDNPRIARRCKSFVLYTDVRSAY